MSETIFPAFLLQLSILFIRFVLTNQNQFIMENYNDFLVALDKMANEPDT